jgi:cell division protein ZapA
MSDDISIKVNIAGKEYPLKISSYEKQDVVAIEQEIEDSLESLKNNCGVNDKQDLLAMFLFQFMLATKKNTNTSGLIVDQSLHDKIKDLEVFVSNYLKASF